EDRRRRQPDGEEPARVRGCLLPGGRDPGRRRGQRFGADGHRPARDRRCLLLQREGLAKAKRQVRSFTSPLAGRSAAKPKRQVRSFTSPLAGRSAAKPPGGAVESCKTAQNGEAGELSSSPRTLSAAFASARSLPNAFSRGRYFMPQLGARISRSGSTKCSALRMRPATVAKSSIGLSSERSMTP